MHRNIALRRFRSAKLDYRNHLAALDRSKCPSEASPHRIKAHHYITRCRSLVGVFRHHNRMYLQAMKGDE